MGDTGSISGGVRPLFRSLAIAASGLSAQRARMDAIASNIANAETIKAAGGQPYRRKVVQLAAVEQGSMAVAEPAGPFQQATMEGAGVRVLGVTEAQTQGEMIYDPGNPEADAAGYVRMPNVNITNEIVDLVDARRSFEANATVFQALKSMLKRATEI